MKFVVGRKSIQRAVNLVGRAVSTRAADPAAYKSILFEVENGALTLAATDLIQHVRISGIPVQETEAGAILLDAGRIRHLVSNATVKDISFRTVKDKCEIKGNGQARLSFIEPTEFPELPSPPDGKAVEVDLGELFSLLSGAQRLVAKDISRPAMMGICLEGGKLYSSDTFHCLVRDVGFNLDKVVFRVEILRLLEPMSSGGVGKVLFNERRIWIQKGKVEVSSGLFEETYPTGPIKELMGKAKKTNTQKMTLQLETLQGILKRIPFRNEEWRCILKCSDGKVNLVAETEYQDGSYTEELAAEHDLPSGYSLGLRPEFLETISLLLEKEVTFLIGGPKDLVLVEGEGLVYWFLPIVLEEDN